MKNYKNNNLGRVLANDDYMIWLKRFSSEYPSFCHDDWTYNTEGTTELDRNNLNRLNRLFQEVMDYADKSGIDAHIEDHEVSYKISYDGIAYEIGCVVGQGSIIYCSRIPFLKTEEFISIESIINDTRIKEIRRNKLNEISIIISELCTSGLSADEIYSHIDKALEKNNLPSQLVQHRTLRK